MNAFETSATVEGQGEIHLVGVPFQPGTVVEVVVSPSVPNGAHGSKVSSRLSRLLTALDTARNNEPVGPLRREELHDRDNLH